jgi:class 3 adenylate cyclase
MEAFISDLEAVVDQLGFQEFDIYAGGPLSPPVLVYTAKHPDRVRRLVLAGAAASGANYFMHPRHRALGQLMDADWDLYAEVVANLTFDWSGGDATRNFAKRIRETLTPEKIRRMGRALVQLDSTEYLAQVKAPTLILQSNDIVLGSPSAARELTAQIPNAQLEMFDSDIGVVWVADMEKLLRTLDDFLWSDSAISEPREVGNGGLRIVLFTDIESSTELTDRLGDEKARDVIRGHEAVVRKALSNHGGSEVKTMGDGFMASFASASQSLDCAIAIQRGNQTANEGADEPLRVRVGLNAGEPIAEDNDLFGTTVIRAARIAAIADGAEILVSNVVRELSEGKSYSFADRGDAPLRGFEETVRIYELGWREGAG